MQRGKCIHCPHYVKQTCTFVGEPSDEIDLRLYAKAVNDGRISFDPVPPKARKPRATHAEMQARREAEEKNR